MGQLALLWNGTWLTWTTFESTASVGRREISSLSMVPEVLKALRKQVDAGASVVHAEWGRAATVIPAALLDTPWSKEQVSSLHELHHGALSGQMQVNLHALDLLEETPCLGIEGETHWESAVNAVFPQARRVPLVHAMLHDAIVWNRKSDLNQGWTFRVDVRDEGAVIVGVDAESLQWVHHLPPGCTAEDVLYAMVNAAHRGGADVHGSRVLWTGQESLTVGWHRFMSIVSLASHSDEDLALTWWPLLQTMKTCG